MALPGRLRVLAAGGVILLILLVILILVIYISTTRYRAPPPGTAIKPKCPQFLQERIRFDCYPEGGASRGACVKRGCCWNDVNGMSTAPACYFPEEYGYNLRGDIQRIEGGWEGTLERINLPTLFGRDVQELRFVVERQRRDRLRIKISDADSKRYEVPYPKAPVDSPSEGVSAGDALYSVRFTKKPFSIQVHRKCTGKLVFDTSVGGLVFSEYFLQISSLLPSSRVYGLGESPSDTFRRDLNQRRMTLFARDTTSSPGSFGSHPFHMNLEDDDGNTSGILLLNSNAMEIELLPAPAITYRVMGGVLDFYIYMGPSPEDVARQHALTVGKPMMPPYWSLGLQFLHRNYTGSADLTSSLEQIRSYGVPNDAHHFDVNSLELPRNVSQYTRLGDIPNHVTSMKWHHVVDLTPRINSSSYLKPGSLPKGVLVNGSDGETPYKVQGKEGEFVFVDFTENASKDWLEEELRRVDGRLAMTGLWLQQNEPSDAKEGERVCSKNICNSPKYIPRDLDGSLSSSTICMDTMQRWGRHYDIHNLYGYSMARVAHQALSAIKPTTRPSIVSRSTFVGSGKYGGHSLGSQLDCGQWGSLKKSVVAMLQFQLFAIPYVGADICAGADEQLQQRWQQLGAFYPLLRYVNNVASKDVSFENGGKSAILTRYRLLPFLYTLFFYSSRDGSTVVRSLMHEFPRDSATYSIDEQFLWGSSLLISPVLQKDNYMVDAYFPRGRWFDYYTGKEIDGKREGRKVRLDAPMQRINAHVRGGTILPLQEPGNTTTLASRLNPMSLLIALNDSGGASGTLYWDDGDSPGTYESGNYIIVKMDVSHNRLKTSTESYGKHNASHLHWEAITIYGIERKPSSVNIDGNNFDTQGADWISYDADKKVMRLTRLRISLVDILYKEHDIHWEFSS